MVPRAATGWSDFDVHARLEADVSVILVRDLAKYPIGVRKCLETNQHWRLRVATTGTIEASRHGGPCVVVVDTALASEEELARIQDSAEFGRRVFGLALLKHDDPGAIHKLLGMGFAGALLRSASAGLVDRAIRAVATGEFWAPRKSLSAMIRELLANQSPRKLTNREEEIFTLLVRGYKNREIAEELLISRETVRWHLRSINSKLGIRDRGNAAQYAAAIPARRADSTEPEAERRAV